MSFPQLKFFNVMKEALIPKMVAFLYLLTLLSLGKVGDLAVITIYPEIRDYFDQLKIAHAQDGDPLASYTGTQKVAACQELIEARIYEAWHEEYPFPSYIENDDLTEYNFQTLPTGSRFAAEFTKDYQRLDFTSDEAEGDVYGFLCVVYSKFNWYLTYGYQEEYKFVLESDHTDIDDGTGLAVFGLLEPTPFINPNLLGPRNQIGLENLFTENAARARQLSNPSTSRVCSLADADKQFRLCSVLHDAYNQIEPFHEGKKNYIKRRHNSCVDMMVTLTSNRNRNEIPVDALPCAVNQEWNAPQLVFHVTADPLDVNSAFLIRYNYVSRNYRLFAHVQNISPLKNIL